jgi:hypothetical protein
MMLVRVLWAELLKMKRTIALKMVLIAPLAVGALVVFMVSQAPFSTLRRNPTGEWLGLARLNLVIWALLMMPLFITLETALVAGLDHADNQWKNLLARPVPRWTFYVAKLVVVGLMTAFSTAILFAGVVTAGTVLPRIQPELHFAPPVPYADMFRQCANVAALAFLALTIQHWVSLRWRAFSIATGFGIVAMVTGYLMAFAGRQTGGWPQYFPWSLPMLVVATPPQNVTAALWMGGLAGLIVAAAGCWDFCRLDVK